MKKLLLLLSAVGMIFTACEAGGGLDEGGNGDLPLNKIATIEEQGANIKATIATLETTKSAVNATIASLNEQQPVTRGNDNGNNGVKDMIAALEERLAALEQMIANLKEYADGDLSEMQDWAEATFATMEQYNALASELATLKALLESFEGVSTAELSDALAASEESMKQWVNEQLSGYATIAEVDAQIAALKESLTAELNEEVEKVVATLTALMNNTKQEYEKAIADAIQNQGIINDKIAEDIANINKRIDEELATINRRLDDIEKRLDEIEEALANLVKQIQSVSYIKKYGDEPTPVVTSAEGASVSLDFEISPKSAVEGLALKWKEVVKVQALYSGTTDFIDMPTTSFSANAKNGIITIVASGENLSQEFYTEQISASLRLEISDGNNDIRSEYITIVPQRWMAEDIGGIPNNEIWYTSSDGNIVTPYRYGDLEVGARVVTNEWIESKSRGVIVFDRDITSIGVWAFSGCSRLTSITIPNSVTSIGHRAFSYCSSLTSITIPDSVTSIGDYAFEDCTSLTSVTIPDSVTSIESAAFSGCTSLNAFYGKFASSDNRCLIIDGVLTSFASSGLTNYTIPNDVTEIGSFAFSCCSLESLTISDKVTSIDGSAFTYDVKLNRANVLISDLVQYSVENPMYKIPCAKYLYNASGSKERLSLTIPIGATKIGYGAFSDCKSLTSITIPNSIVSIELNAFYECTNLLKIYCKNQQPFKIMYDEVEDTDGNITQYSSFPVNPSMKIYVPRNSVEAYKSAQYWSDYADYIVGYDF